MYIIFISKHLLLYIVLLIVFSQTIHASTITMQIQDEAIYGFNLLVDEPTDPIFGGEPIELTITGAEFIESASLEISAGPVVIESLEIEGTESFDISFSQNDSLLTILLNRISESSATTMIIKFIPNEFDYNDLSVGFGEFQFLDWDIETVDDEPVEVETDFGSWFVITDFGTNLPVMLQSTLTGENLGAGFDAILLGYKHDGEFALLNQKFSSISDNNGVINLMLRSDPMLLIEEEVDSCFYAKDVEIIFVIELVPPPASEYQQRVIEIVTKPQDFCSDSQFFESTVVEITPDVAVRDWLHVK